jgi:hypothetical protein
MVPIQPVVIQGPACVEFDGAFHYSNGGVTVDLTTATSATPSDAFGELGDTFKSRVAKVSVPLVGERKNFDKIYAHSMAGIGRRLFNPAGAANKPLKVHSYEDLQTYTFARAGVYAAPTLNLSPNKTLFSGSLEFLAAADYSKAPTATDFWRTIAAITGGTWPAQFDADLVTKEIFHASIGALAAPFNALSARDGFEVTVGYKFGELSSDEVGIVDYALVAVTVGLKFAPANLTKTDPDTLLLSQGAGSLIPGVKIGKKGQTITITSDSLKVDLKNMGAKDLKELFAPSKDRIGDITFVNSVSTTAGVADELIVFTDLTA